jgi:hypothetical protein
MRRPWMETTVSSRCHGVRPREGADGTGRAHDRAGEDRACQPRLQHEANDLAYRPSRPGIGGRRRPDAGPSITPIAGSQATDLAFSRAEPTPAHPSRQGSWRCPATSQTQRPTRRGSRCPTPERPRSGTSRRARSHEPGLSGRDHPTSYPPERRRQRQLGAVLTGTPCGGGGALLGGAAKVEAAQGLLDGRRCRQPRISQTSPTPQENQLEPAGSGKLFPMCFPEA